MLHVHYISSASPKLELYHQVWLDVNEEDFLTEKSGNPVIINTINRYLWYYTIYTYKYLQRMYTSLSKHQKKWIKNNKVA